jgi:uncharacterized protein (DUF885 family)
MKRFLIVLVVPALTIGLTSCAVQNADTVVKQRISMDTLAARFYEGYAKLNPITVMYYGDNRFNDLFPNDVTTSYRIQKEQFYTEMKSQLASQNYDSLSENEKLIHDVLSWYAESRLEGLKFRNYLTPINQLSSHHLTIGDLASGTGAQPFRSVTDYENWLRRLDGYVTWCDTVIVNMRKGIKEGYVLPKSLVVKTIPQFEDLSRGPIEDLPFYSPLKNFPIEFSAEEKVRLTAAFRDAIGNKVVPMHLKMKEFLEEEYLPASRETSGIGALPGGKEYYDYLIKDNTTTSLTADSIFSIGQREVKRILGETELVKRQLHFNGDLKSFFEYVRNKKELMPYTNDQQVIANFNAIHEKMRPNLQKLFNKTPKSAFEVRRTPEFREASASVEYFVPSEDGSRPGIFYVPIPDATKYHIMRDENLFLHEAIPGHHYQVSLALENKALPRIMRIISFDAYAEGWALYTESLGNELGLYEDSYQYLGMLGNEMHRAIRLVVDAGMHAKGWTREQAIQFSKDHEALTDQAIIAEIERYMAIPGQALSYKIGQMKIRELRSKAEQELGVNFNIAEFHDQVLGSGSLPLEVLEKKIDRWIASKKR